MKSLRIAFLAVMWVALVSGVARSQTVSEVGEASRWLERWTSSYQQYLNVIDVTNALDEISLGLMDGEITEAFARRRGVSNIASARMGYDRAVDAHARLPAIPPLPDIPLRGAMEVRERYLDLLKIQIADLVEVSTEIFAAALRGDTSVQDNLATKQLNQFAAVLQGENLLIREQLTLLASSSPVYSLLSAALTSNDAILAFFHTAADPNFDEGSLQRSLNRGELSLFESEKSILEGRHNLRAYRRQYSPIGVRDVVERRNREVLAEMMDSLAGSLDVEDQIVGSLRELFDILIDGNTDLESFNDAMTLFDLKISSLVESRMSLQREREGLAGQLME